MTDRELMQMALNALEHYKSPDSTIKALRARLAQPESEPFEYWSAVEGWVKIDEVRQHFDTVGCGTIYKTAGEDRVALYSALTQPEPEETIAKWIKANTEHRQWYICPKCSYQAPRFKNEWQGLTDYEVNQIEIAASSKSSAIYLSEAKLKEKNT